MNLKYIAIVAVIAATLVGTTAISADSALAYEKSQATSQVNECGNGAMPMNVYCQNIGSQIQGEENGGSYFRRPGPDSRRRVRIRTTNVIAKTSLFLLY